MRLGAKISVIIPMLNEEASIGKALRAIPNWVDEVITTDNGSGDRCAGFLAPAQKSSGLFFARYFSPYRLRAGLIVKFFLFICMKINFGKNNEILENGGDVSYSFYFARNFSQNFAE